MRSPSLKSALSVTMLAMAAITLAISASLIVLTMYLRNVADQLAKSVESVSLVQDAEVELLLHSRTIDPLVRSGAEANLLQSLLEARRYVNDEQEKLALQEAVEAVGKYLTRSGAQQADSEQEHDLATAFASLAGVVSINRAQSRSAQQQAVQWDNLANTTAVAGTALLIVLLVIALAWLTTQVIAPIVRLRNTMDRFAQGDLNARAPESGPAELRAMAIQFNGMAAALARQREAQMSYLAGAAHDMRSPLTVLKASVALTRMQSALSSEEQIRRAFTLVERQIGALERMVGDLLDTARIEAGKFELDLSYCDVRELARNAVELFQSGSPRHRLHLTIPERPVIVRSDPTRLQQVLHNLVGNAIKYSPSGGDIHVDVAITDDATQVTVSDQGIGIAPEDLPHIFEPFRRAHSGAMQGTGLGLYIVRQIAEAHGGRIDVVSSPGEGSRFVVVLPLTGPERSTESARGSPAAPFPARTTRHR